MATLLEWITNEANGETVEAVVFGKHGSDRETPSLNYPVLTWEQAAPLLGYEFNSGFGSPECHAVYAWTASRVIFVSTYDGSTSIASVPRNPISCNPEMFGGG